MALLTPTRSLLLVIGCFVVAGACGGGTVPAEVPDSDATGDPTASDELSEPEIPADAPPPAPVGADEIPDVPPAD